MKTSTTDTLTKLNATIEELDAFTWVTGENRDNATHEALKAYYYIGKFMVKLDKNNSQKEAKAIRDQYLVGNGLPLKRNESSACKQMAVKFNDLQDLKVAWAKTGSVSINAARIWSTLNQKDNTKTIDEQIKSRIDMVSNGSKSATKLIEGGEIKTFANKLEKYQMLEIALMNEIKAVKATLGKMRVSDEFKAMVKEIAEQPSEHELKMAEAV